VKAIFKQVSEAVARVSYSDILYFIFGCCFFGIIFGVLFLVSLPFAPQFIKEEMAAAKLKKV
jgi:hypothetical protein